jgi:hypothetical protein
MRTWLTVAPVSTALEPFSPTAPLPPVDDLLLVYLGQSSGSRAPDSDPRPVAVDVQDLWDHLGDFA